MRPSLIFLLLGFLVLVGVSTAGQETPATGAKIRILLTYGGHGFDQKAFFPMFDTISEITYTKAPLPESAERLKPGLEKDFDVIVMYDMVRSFSPEQQKAFIDLLNVGIGLVALHHNIGAHNQWDEFRKIIGGKFIFSDCEIDGQRFTKSPWFHDQVIKVRVTDKEHPITRDMQDFEIVDEVYGKLYVAPDNHVLLTTDHPKSNPELAWTRTYGKSRVFYLMLGHDAKAWRNPNYTVLLRRAIRWVAGK